MGQQYLPLIKNQIKRPFILPLLLLFSFSLVACASQTQAQEPVPRFGVIESYESPADATALGVGWTRVRFQWGEMQPNSPDEWLPIVDEATIASETDAGREVTGILLGIPLWAQDENQLPLGLYLPHDHPDNLWARFVQTAVTRHQLLINHWIIWNEPDIREGALGNTWHGTVADFAQLQKVAYLTIKEANPEAVVHLSAFTYWADVNAGTEQYMALLLDELLRDPQASQHNSYFDVATAHLYFQPEQVYDLLTFFTGLMRERGLNQPIWLVETNAPPRDDPVWIVEDWFLSVLQPEQANFMPQGIASAMSAGAERIAVYKLIDTETDRVANPEPFGLVRMNGERRPAFQTYQVAIQQFAGTQATTRERWDEVGQFRHWREDGNTVDVLFARLPVPQTAVIPTSNTTATLINQRGESQPITAQNGQFIVELPPAICSHSIGDYCMIGGETFYLVQVAESTPPATATPVPSPTVPASPTPLPPTAPPDITATPTTLATVTMPTIPTNTPTPPATVVPVQTDEPAGGNPLGLIVLGVALLLGAGLFWFSRQK